MKLIKTITASLLALPLALNANASSTQKSIYIVADAFTLEHLSEEIERFSDDVAQDTNSKVVTILQGETAKDTRDALVTAYKEDNLWGVFLVGQIQPVNSYFDYQGDGYQTGESTSFRPYYNMLDCPFGEENLAEPGLTPVYERAQNSSIMASCESKVWLAEIQPPTWDSDETVQALKRYFDNNHAQRNSDAHDGYWFKSALNNSGANPDWSAVITDIVTDTQSFSLDNIETTNYYYFDERERGFFIDALAQNYSYVQLLADANTDSIKFPDLHDTVTITKEEISQLTVNAKIVDLNVSDSNYTSDRSVSDFIYPKWSLASELLFAGNALLVVHDSTISAVGNTNSANYDSYKWGLEEQHQLLAQGHSLAENWLNSAQKEGINDVFVGDPTIRINPKPENGPKLEVDGFEFNARNRLIVHVGDTSTTGSVSKAVTIKNNGTKALELAQFVHQRRTTFNHNQTSAYGVFSVKNSNENKSIPYRKVRTVEPGESTTYVFEFTPGNSSISDSFEDYFFESYVHFTSNDANVGNFTVELTANHFIDTDGDGAFDKDDAFPEDSSEWLDTDADGIGNNADTDDDNDGVDDTDDAFPLDATESIDTDLDGIGNNADNDDDNDGVNDEEDLFPLDATESMDSDQDGIGNNADTDDDNDGVEDTSDAFPLDPNETVDTDNDGIGNNADTDDDNDGVEDSADAYPLDASRSVVPVVEVKQESSSGGGSSSIFLVILMALLTPFRSKRSNQTS